jgi:ArsR family transcriptional regulator
MKALSNENRLAMFEYIRAGHGKGRLDEENRPSVCDVAGNFDMALSTISHHMKELRNAGLIKCVRDGQTIHWVVNEETVGLMVSYLTGKDQPKRWFSFLIVTIRVLKKFWKISKYFVSPSWRFLPGSVYYFYISK